MSHLEWATEDQFGNQFTDWGEDEEAARKKQNDRSTGYRYSLFAREVTDWEPQDD